MGEEFQIKPGATGDDGRFAPRQQIVDDRQGEPDISHGVDAFRRVEDAVEVMRDFFPVAWGGSGGEGFQAAVELEGVGIDDLPAEFRGEAQGERALARGGGTADEEQALGMEKMTNN